MSQPNPRPKLSESEWRRIKIDAARKGKTLGDYTADALRAVLKGAKP